MSLYSKDIEIFNSIESEINENEEIFNAGIHIFSNDNNFSYKFYKGNMINNSLFSIASITKLFTTSIILKLVDENLITLDSKLIEFFDGEILDNLLKGEKIDASYSITISDLLSHASGFPDYFTENGENMKSYLGMISEKDFSFSFKDTIDRTKELTPHNLKSDSAYYSDINFDLLGEIAKKITGLNLEDIYDKYVFHPLNLKSTGLHKVDTKTIPLYKNKNIFYTPLARSSLYASGGLFSTLDEIGIFIKSFFDSQDKRLFQKDNIKNQIFRKMQWYPFEYGLGMMRYDLSKIVGFDLPPLEILGHSGSIGSFAFYCPLKDLFIVGSFNQIKSNPFPIILKYLNSIKNS